MYHCKECLTGRTGDVLGDPCKTPECDGVIEEIPDFRTLVDELSEPMDCPRRGEGPQFSQGPDYWLQFKSNGDRVCSYCGSLHPDDFLALVEASADAPADATYNSAVQIEPSDKLYKIYVNQPNVRNAHEGGIKFYTKHLPMNDDGTFDVTNEQHDEYSRAVKASRARFAACCRSNR